MEDTNNNNSNIEIPLINKIKDCNQDEQYNAMVSSQMQVDKMRLEPKTIFANERTYVKWLHFGLLIVMAGFLAWDFSMEYLNVFIVCAIMGFALLT